MAFVWDDVAMLVGPLLGGLFGGNSGDGDSPTTTAEQRALQQEMLKLIQRQSGYMGQMDPLRESVLKMAMGMLPIRYQTGGSFASPTPAGMPSSGGRAVVQTGATNPALGSGEPYVLPGGGMDRSLGAFTPGRDATLYQPYDPTTGIGHRWDGGGGYSDIVDQFFAEQSNKGMNPWDPGQ